MKEIPLTQEKVALVDDEDWEEASRYRWCADQKRNTWYALTTVGRKQLYMHNLLMGADPSGRTVDHRNTNGLDNRRGNLRWATHGQQMMNRNQSRSNTVGFKGVRPNGRNGWMARVKVNRVTHYVGTFRTKEEAAKAYDQKARELHGEFARTNFDDD